MRLVRWVIARGHLPEVVVPRVVDRPRIVDDGRFAIDHHLGRRGVDDLRYVLIDNRRGLVNNRVRLVDDRRGLLVDNGSWLVNNRRGLCIHHRGGLIDDGWLRFSGGRRYDSQTQSDGESSQHGPSGIIVVRPSACGERSCGKGDCR